MPKRTWKGVPKIESGIPMQNQSRGQRGFYPYFQMKVGQSFLIPKHLKEATAYGVAREGNKTAILAEKPHRFRTGKCSDGFRCWRTE